MYGQICKFPTIFFLLFLINNFLLKKNFEVKDFKERERNETIAVKKDRERKVSCQIATLSCPGIFCLFLKDTFFGSNFFLIDLTMKVFFVRIV